MKFVKVMLIGILAMTLLLVSAKIAQATPFTLALKITVSEGGPPVNYELNIFTSPANPWPCVCSGPSLLNVLVSGLGAGPHVFYLDVNGPDPSQIYFTGVATFLTPGFFSAAVAEPSTGSVPDILVAQFGAPWVSLAGLTSGPLFGIHKVVDGPAYPGDGIPARWEALVTPEPGSLLLLGTGLAVAAIASKRLRGRGPSPAGGGQ